MQCVNKLGQVKGESSFVKLLEEFGEVGPSSQAQHLFFTSTFSAVYDAPRLVKFGLPTEPSFCCAL